MALATTSKQLHVTRVAIQWGPSQSDKQMPPGSVPLNPVMKERHLAATSWLQNDAAESPLDASMTHLTHLEIIPSTLDTQHQAWAPPIILAVRSYVAPSDAPPEATAPYPEAQSIIDRWEIIYEQPQSLHSAFEQLGSRRNSIGASAPTV